MAGCSDPPPSDPSPYTVTDLGSGRCVAVNSSGVVLGVDNADVAFTVDRAGVRTPLGSASADEITVALSIADNGTIAGYAEGPKGRRAVIRVDGQWKALEGLGSYSAASWAGKDGTVAGITGATGDPHGFVLDGAVARTLPLPTNRSSAVYAALGGRVIGIVETEAGETHGFVIEGGTLTDVGTLGGRLSSVLALNARGDVVGAAENAAGRTRAFWKSTGKPQLTDLGLPTDGAHADARGLDDAGRITGNVELADGVSRPALFEAGKAPVSFMPLDSQGRPYVSAHVAAAAANGTVVGWGAPRGAVGGALHCLRWTTVTR